MEKKGEDCLFEQVLCREHPGYQERQTSEGDKHPREHGRKSLPFLISDSIATLAAVLDSTGMKAGDQYSGEAKLLHIESGFPWSEQLELKMSSCKRAMKRDKGPEVRAKELKLEEIPENVWEAKVLDETVPVCVAWSYAWAKIWMLRATEAANLDRGHVQVLHDQKVVKLRIVKSKMDQRALGVTRTMQCCGKQQCARKCPYGLAVKILESNTMKGNKDPLFPTHANQRLPKVKLVEAWAKFLDTELTGHSARRPGAMMWTREGLNVTDISFLGRWKSSALFRYIEDALSEVPLNRKDSQQTSEQETKMQEGVEIKVPRTKREAAASSFSKKAVPVAECKDPTFPSQKILQR